MRNSNIIDKSIFSKMQQVNTETDNYRGGRYL